VDLSSVTCEEDPIWTEDIRGELDEDVRIRVRDFLTR
jgi:hypothetical protein